MTKCRPWTQSNAVRAPEEWINTGSTAMTAAWGRDCSRNVARRSTSVSIDILLQISSSKIPRILTAREKEGGTSAPGKLAARRYLCRCHSSSCCACQGDISVNMSPQSSIAVGTHTRGGEPVVSDTGQRRKPNSWCWAWGMQRSNKPTGQLERAVRVPPWRHRVLLRAFLKVIQKMKCMQQNDGRNITWGHR